ncbi:MAG: gamma-glutamylcyclotransferase [Endomicrobium sp.]|jgi:gamma-glutamylcyclotransferase (GGCT)/AIG2-like uncharacterized protein YtfP|nr:gamma-glutamylcyclotransferase [Endomicrobium sp.]
MEYLFSYGTLQDKTVQMRLFGTNVHSLTAVLLNHAVVCVDGYLSIVPYSGEEVVGEILELSSLQLQIADKWEEVPLYTRSHIVVTTSAGLSVVWVYFRAIDTQTLDINKYVGRLHGMSDEEFEQDIKSFNHCVAKEQEEL